MKEWKIVAHLLLMASVGACALKPAQNSSEMENSSSRNIAVRACYDGYSGIPNGDCGDPDDRPLEVKISIENIQGEVLFQGKTSNHGEAHAKVPRFEFLDLVSPKTEIITGKNGVGIQVCIFGQDPEFSDDLSETFIDLPYHQSYCNPLQREENNAVLLRFGS